MGLPNEYFTASPAQTQVEVETENGVKGKLSAALRAFPFVERVLVVLSLASLALVCIYFKS